MREFLDRLLGGVGAGPSGRDRPAPAGGGGGSLGSLSDDERARHEAAARAVLRSMAEDPPGAASSHVGMPELPPLPDMPARGGNLSAVRGEEAFAETMRAKGRDGLVVVKFGASWCTHCAEMLPEFGDASRKYPDAHFVLADVDTLPETAEHVRFTPTFTFYRKGRKVDEIAKIKPRALRDRMWMHADDPEEEPHE